MLTLAFDTATNVATSALLEDGSVLGERTGIPARLLEDVDALLNGADAGPKGPRNQWGNLDDRLQQPLSYSPGSFQNVQFY